MSGEDWPPPVPCDVMPSPCDVISNQDSPTERDSGINSSSGGNNHNSSEPPNPGSSAAPQLRNRPEELPADLAELRALKDQLWRQREELLRDEEHAKLSLEIFRLREEICHLRSSQRGTGICTYRASAPATYEAHFMRYSGTHTENYLPPPDPSLDRSLSDSGPIMEEVVLGQSKAATAQPMYSSSITVEVAAKADPPPEEVLEEHGTSHTDGVTPAVHIQLVDSKMPCCARAALFVPLLILAFLVLCATIVLHVLAWYPTGVFKNLFMHDRQYHWDTWDLDFLPAKWIFWLWVGIYALQFIWYVYAFTVPCRTTNAPGLLYLALTPTALVLLSLSHGCTLAWIFVWDRLGYHNYSIICLAGTCVFSIAALAVLAWSIHKYSAELSNEAPCDLWLLRLWVLNGVAAQAAWNIMILRYHGNTLIHSYTELIAENNLYIYIAFAAVFLVTWFLIDILAIKQAFSYVFTPYIVPIVTLITLLLRKSDYKELHFIITALLVALYGLLIVVKIGVTVGRERDTLAHEASEEDLVDKKDVDDEKDIQTFHYVPVSPLDSSNKSEASDGSYQRY